MGSVRVKVPTKPLSQWVKNPHQAIGNEGTLSLCSVCIRRPPRSKRAKGLYWKSLVAHGLEELSAGLTHRPTQFQLQLIGTLRATADAVPKLLQLRWQFLHADAQTSQQGQNILRFAFLAILLCRLEQNLAKPCLRFPPPHGFGAFEESHAQSQSIRFLHQGLYFGSPLRG